MMEKEEEIEEKAEIYLVKTAHVSEESVKKVRSAIEDIDPDVVGVELDINRYRTLKEKEDSQKPFLGFLRGNVFLGVLHKLLSSLQDRVGEDLGIEPGSEMLEAIEVAEENDVPVALLDRDMEITMKKMWKKMTLKEKFKMFGALILGLFGFGRKRVDLDEITDEDNVDFLMKEFRKFSPGAAEAIIDERDAYIAARILAHSVKGNKIVAVIGAGHEKGVVHYLKNPGQLPLPKSEI